VSTVINELDSTDQHLITLLRHHPRASVSELARRSGLARGTVHTRLERLEQSAVVRGFGPDVDAKLAGYDVQAFTSVSIAQGRHDETIAKLAALPEVIEVHTVTGDGDLLLRIVASTNDHLNDVLQEITHIPEVGRTQTQLALASPVQRSVADLIAARLDR
jgi:DNA-binding Lrp family transcriptional regulator